ncbi:hypothetical protein Herbaro_09260 [Herbaspirillum sp. WKF16]|nr:hypothetical protein [Herbaspirillum sp. WKF16]WDZ97948.1 hypothetical protein Herbaro_09260 [Herbaspirillum sp. WKF16]
MNALSLLFLALVAIFAGAELPRLPRLAFMGACVLVAAYFGVPL